MNLVNTCKQERNKVMKVRVDYRAYFDTFVFLYLLKLLFLLSFRYTVLQIKKTSEKMILACVAQWPMAGFFLKPENLGVLAVLAVKMIGDIFFFSRIAPLAILTSIAAEQSSSAHKTFTEQTAISLSTQALCILEYSKNPQLSKNLKIKNLLG